MHRPHHQPADASRTREEALDWFVRRQGEDFSAEDEQAFQAWLVADAAHPQAFAHWHDEWQAVDEIPPDLRRLLQGNLAYDQALQAASGAGRPITPPSAIYHAQPAPTRRRMLVPAVAMVAAAIVTGGAGLLAWQHVQTQPLFTQVFSTPRGQQAEVPLPDGSRLRLDTATRVEVAYYRQRREVILHGGQAVFAVHGDLQRPFHVQAGDVRVTVVGTRFSVRYTPDVPGSAGVHVAVEEGLVQVHGKAASSPVQAVSLSAGQQVASDDTGLLAAVSPVPTAGIAPWREHRVSFDNVRLDHALAELARYSDPQLVIRDPAVAALPITGVFDPRDMATFHRVLPASLPVRLKKAEGATAEVVLAR